MILMKKFNSIVMVQKVKMEKLFFIYGILERVEQVQKPILAMDMEKKEHIMQNEQLKIVEEKKVKNK